MNREDTYLKTLIRELPKEKAPEDITQLIMQKIAAQKAAVVPVESVKVWQTQAFYIMIAIAVLEALSLWSLRSWLTLSNFESLLKSLCIRVYQYFALNNFSALLMGGVLVGVFLYLFVKGRIESTKCCVGMA